MVFRMLLMDISAFLKTKYYELQLQERRNVTVEEFGSLFGAGKSLMAMWMNGDRKPGPKYKNLIIERYGEEAIQAFGEDPRLYFINENWDSADESLQKSIHEQMQENVNKNDVRRTQKQGKKRRTE